MIGKQRQSCANCLNRCRKAEESPWKNRGWHSTQIFWTPVSCNNCPKDGSIKAGAEILISLTLPAGSAFRKKERSAATAIVEKSKMDLVPVRWAIRVTGGIISSGRQTNAIIGTRCSANMLRPLFQRETLTLIYYKDFLYMQYFFCILAPASSTKKLIDSLSSRVQPSSR